MKTADRHDQEARIHRTRKVYTGRAFSFVTEDVTLPNGSRSEMAFVRHPGSTAIVPLMDDNAVIMERQYRHPVRGYLFEIPAGTMDPGETALACARRELEEETGYRADEFVELGITHILPAYSDELIHLYLARCLSLSEQRLDPDEIINVVKYPLDEALKMIETGQITDALTILALQRTWFHIKGKG